MYVGDGTVIRSREVKPSYRQRPPLRDPEVRREVPAVARAAPPQERPLVGAGRPTGARAGPARQGEGGEDTAEVAILAVAAAAPPASALAVELPSEEPAPSPAVELPTAEVAPSTATPPPAVTVPAPKRAPRRSRSETSQAALLGRIAELEHEIANLAARIQSLEVPADPNGERGLPAVAQAYVYTGGGAELAVGPVTVNRQTRRPKAP